jgi:hypothetical protein
LQQQEFLAVRAAETTSRNQGASGNLGKPLQASNTRSTLVEAIAD